MGLIWIIAAAGWGVAEATLFFIVPDVVLTAAVLRLGPRKALSLAAVAALAASFAGIGMWWWGASDPAGARAAMLAVPAIGPDLMDRATEGLDGWWPAGLFAGAITGVPYKLYAVQAGARAIPLLPFVAVSFFARLARFSLSVAVTAVGARLVDRLGYPHRKGAVLAAGWIALYAVYFALRFLASAGH